MPRVETHVVESWEETPTIHAIRLQKPDGFTFSPGQYSLVEIPVGAGREDHTFSLACSPTRNYLEFATRMSESSYKQAFAQLKAGDAVTLMGPSGHFVLDESLPHSALLSGGIGITPFRSMLEYACDKHLPNQLTLFYGNRSAADIPFRNELDSLHSLNSNISIFQSVSEASPEWKGRVGRIDGAFVEEHVGKLDSAMVRFFICGPPAMVSGLQQVLTGANVPADRIAMENFSGYA